MEKNISIIIVSYFTGASLWMCIYRALQLDGGKEIIIASNGNEQSVEMRLRQLEENNPRVKVLIGHGNIGFGPACNMATDHATGDFLLFLNPDSVAMEKDAAIRMRELFAEEHNPPVGLVGGLLRNDDGTEQRGSRRNIITPINAMIEGSGLHHLRGVAFPVINLDHTPTPAEPVPVGAVSGACMMMERERFIQIGKFDPDYFLHVEDMDLCLRVHKAGGGIWLRSDVNILHYRSTSEVKALFVERKKTMGFYRYFNLHYHFNPVQRIAAIVATTLRFGAKIALSLFQELKAYRLLTDAKGMKRVQAIVRGMNTTRLNANKNGLGKTIMVTGASSPVGLYTLGRLLGDGYRVIALVHKTNIGFFHPNLAWVRADLSQKEELADALRNYRCEAVIHCAPIWLAQTMLPIARGIGAERVVGISSTSLLTKKKHANSEERAVVQRLEDGEAAFQEEARQMSMAWTILRPTMIYGAGLDQNVTRVANELDCKRRFYIERPASGKRAPVHADDLAHMAINAVHSPVANGKIYNAQGGEVLTYYRMVERIAKTMEKPYNIKSIPGLAQICSVLHPIWPKKIPSGSIVARMQQDQVFPDDRVENELGVSPRRFLQDGLIDLGVTSEPLCRSLLDIYVENAVYFAGRAAYQPKIAEAS